MRGPHTTLYPSYPASSRELSPKIHVYNTGPQTPGFQCCSHRNCQLEFSNRMPIFRPTFLVVISLIFLFLSVSARPPQTPLAQQEPPTNNLCYFFEIFTDIKRCRHHCHREVVTSTETCTVTRTKTRACIFPGAPFPSLPVAVG